MGKTHLGYRYRHFIDTETTGLRAWDHEILDVAVVTEEVDPSDLRRSTPVRIWSRKISPVNLEAAEPKALEVNGYSPEKWVGAPTFAEVATELADVLRDGVLVGHNVGFDVGFLEEAFYRVGVTPQLGYHHIDTITLAYVHLVLPSNGITALKLDRIRRHLGWPLEGAHGALRDALDARALFYRCTNPTDPAATPAP